MLRQLSRCVAVRIGSHLRPPLGGRWQGTQTRWMASISAKKEAERMRMENRKKSLSTKQELFIGSLRVHQSNRILSLHFNVTEHAVNDHFSNVIGQMRDQLMVGKTQVPPVTDATWHKMIGSPFLEHDGGQSHEADTNNSQPKIEVSSSSSESDSSDSSDSDDNDSPFIQKRKLANDGSAIDTLDWTVRSEKEAFMKAKKGGTKTENGVAKEETGKQATEIGLKDTEKSEGPVETSAGIDEDVVENETETPAKKKGKATPEERQAILEEKERRKREREEERERRRVAKEEEKKRKREEREKQKYARNELKDLVQNISQQKKNVIYLRHLILNENAARRKEILDEIVKEVAGPKKIKLPKEKVGKNTDENTEPEPEPEPVVVVRKRKHVLGKPWMNAFDVFLLSATKSVRLEYMREAKMKMEEKEEKEILQKMNRRSKWEEEEKQVEAAKKTTKRGKPETQNEPKTKKGRGSKESLESLEEFEKYYQNEKAMFAAKFWDDVTVKLNALVDSYEAKVGRVAVPKLENADTNMEYRKSYTAKQCKVRFNEIEQQKMISNLRESQSTDFDREAAAREVLEEFKTNGDFDPEE